MVLLDAVVKILALADPDRFQSTLRAVLRSMCRVAGNYGFPVGLACVDDDAIGTAMTLQRLSTEALGRRQMPMLDDLDRCSLRIDQERSALRRAKGQVPAPVMKLIGCNDCAAPVEWLEGILNLDFLPQTPGIMRSLQTAAPQAGR